jgi:hypothetical protein
MGLPLFALGLWLNYLILRRSGVDLKALNPGKAGAGER